MKTTAKTKTALLVVDVQVDVIAQAFDRDAVVERIAGLVARARDEGAPVIWVQHDDDELVRFSEGWHIDARLAPLDGEPVIFKTFSDSFSDTSLEQTLNELGVSTIVMLGAQSDFCIRNTWHSALLRGFDTVLVSDAHTTVDVHLDDVTLEAREIISFTNFYAAFGSRYPTAHGRVASAADVTFLQPG